jgi:hypothetical protein
MDLGEHLGQMKSPDFSGLNAKHVLHSRIKPQYISLIVNYDHTLVYSAEYRFQESIREGSQVQASPKILKFTYHANHFTALMYNRYIADPAPIHPYEQGYFVISQIRFEKYGGINYVGCAGIIQTASFQKGFIQPPFGEYPYQVSIIINHRKGIQLGILEHLDHSAERIVCGQSLIIRVHHVDNRDRRINDSGMLNCIKHLVPPFVAEGIFKVLTRVKYS